jgi:hypothetical protein
MLVIADIGRLSVTGRLVALGLQTEPSGKARGSIFYLATKNMLDCAYKLLYHTNF